jgi:purine-binding chemotaxis protein CheW
MDSINNQNDLLNPLNSTGKEEQFVVFKLGGEEFGISINEVLEISKLIDITRIPNSEKYIKGVINLRGRIHLVIDLAQKLGLPIKEKDDDSRIILIETKKDAVGMMVDSVKEVLNVTDDHIRPVPKMVNAEVHEDYLKNVVIIGERLIILLDLSSIMGLEEEKVLELAKEEAASKEEAPKQE